MAKLTKTIESFNNNGFKQDVQIDVDFDETDNSIYEVLDVQAFNFINGEFKSVVSIKEFLEGQDALDRIIESINWREIYQDSKELVTA